MAPLREFLHTGILPFVGRTGEVERIVEFWRATPEAQRLRAALVLAEAGIGKSRLLEEVMRRIAASGGTIVHVKLYPEAGTSLPAVMARSLWFSNGGRELLRQQPEETRASVIGALRRLCRLRPTLLVLEDAHLLDEDSLKDVAVLLDALADETLSLLCLARPTELRARSILEGYLNERMEMTGLGPREIAMLWSDLFGCEADARVLGLLHDATLGSPLALRSGLRAAIDSRVIAEDRESGTWRLSDSPEAFATLVGRSVELLSEGMVLHLTAGEREAAETLATLGEVFARETAGLMIADAPAMIRALMSKGIIATVTASAAPLAGLAKANRHRQRSPGRPASDFPLLSFTHTLLHKYLAERARVDPRGLLDAIAGNAPLFSLLPLHLIRRSAPAIEAPASILTDAIERLFNVIASLDLGSEWQSSMAILETATALHERFGDEVDEATRRVWRIRLEGDRIWLLRRTIGREGRLAHCEKTLSLTGDLLTEELANCRMGTMVEWIDLAVRNDHDLLARAWSEIDAMLEAYPSLAISMQYINCLATISNIALHWEDAPTLHGTFERFDELLLRDDLEEEFRMAIQVRVYSSYLIVFQTPEELEHRMGILAEYRQLPSLRGNHLEMRCVDFYMQIGMFETALPVIDDMLVQFGTRGDDSNIFISWIYRAFILGAFGTPLDEIEPVIMELWRKLPATRASIVGGFAAEWMAGLGVMLGRPDRGRAMLDELSRTAPVGPREFLILLLMAEGRLAEADAMLDHDWSLNFVFDQISAHALRELIALASGAREGADATLAALRCFVEMPMVRIWNVIIMGRMLPLCGMMTSDPRLAPFAAEASELLRAGTTSQLDWLARHSLFAFMTPLLDAATGHIPAREDAAWRQRIATIAEGVNIRPRGSESPDRIRISMLGTIRAGRPGEEMVPLRGSRVRLVLGLMVADQMIGRSLTHTEFVRIAGGAEEETLELARKKRNMTIARLRETLGEEAILTDGKTPSLNLDRVEVDILMADALIRKSLAAVRDGSLVRARPLLEEALEMTRGEVPFPTLYETFFEAAREDFEFRLRTAVLDVSRGLLREGDAAGAEVILRHGFNATPDDEELAELLREALTALGNRVEAERIRMRSREAVG